MATRRVITGSNTASGGSALAYANPLSYQAFSSTESDVQIKALIACKLCDARITLSSAPGMGNSITFTIRINGVDTALTWTISDLALTGSDTTHIVTCAPGDLISVKITPSGGPANKTFVHSINVSGLVTGESFYAEHNAPAGGIFVRSALFSQRNFFSAGGSIIYNVAAAAGNVTNFDVKVDAAPGLGKSATFVIYKNGVAQNGSGGTPDTRVAISGASTTGSASFTLPITGGDQCYIEISEVGSPSINGAATSIKFVATTDGESQFCGFTVDNLTTGTNYNYPDSYAPISWNTPESTRHAFGAIQSFDLNKLYVGINGSQSITLSLRKNDASPGGIQTFTGSSSGSDLTGTATIADGDTFDMKLVTGGFSDYLSWGMIQYALSTGACGPNGTITVTKTTVPGADPTVFLFTAPGLTPSSFTLSDGDSQVLTGPDGTYNISETVPPGWSAGYVVSSGDPHTAIVLNAGDDITVDVTNTKLNKLIITKVTDPTGSAAVFPFTTTGGLSPASFDLSDGDSQEFDDLPDGTYGVSETPQPNFDTAYVVSNADPHTAIDLSGGVTVTVTVTNTYNAAMASGIYKIVPGKRNDTLYTNLDPIETEDVAIPNPFAKLPYLGG